MQPGYVEVNLFGSGNPPREHRALPPDARLDKRYRPFTEQLALLASQYQSKAILSLMEQHLSGTQPT